MDITRLKLPFGATIAGLATFVPRKEKLVRIKFSARAGFDDRLFSKDELNVPGGMKPRFYYLWPPEKINYFQFGRWQTTEVDWDMSQDADVSYGDVAAFFPGVPVVQLHYRSIRTAPLRRWFGPPITAPPICSRSPVRPRTLTACSPDKA